MTFNQDVRAVTSDGRELPVDINLNPIHVDEGLLVIATIRDISEHKRIEAALMEERSLIYSLVNSIQDVIFWKDGNGLYQGCNQAFTRAFGKSAAELVGMSDYDLYPREIAESNRKQDQYLLESRRLFHEEQHCTFVDGSQVILDTLLTPYMDEQGNLLGILGVSRDITQYKQMAGWLAEAKVRADAANQAKGEFLANMSHDIRTPMNAIIGLSQLALDTELDKQQRDYVQKVYSAAQNLLGIINDILDFSKIDAGKLEMEFIDFDLAKVLDHVGQVVGQRAGEKGLDFLFDYPSDLPTALVGDPLRLGQVLINLANNAVKFTERGEVVIGIAVRERDAEHVSLRFTVRDTGIGLSEEQQSRLFQAFSQTDASTTRRHGGTGLGLAICKRLVEMMGGEIGLDSAPGQHLPFQRPFRRQRQTVPRRQYRAASAAGRARLGGGRQRHGPFDPLPVFARLRLRGGRRGLGGGGHRQGAYGHGRRALSPAGAGLADAGHRWLGAGAAHSPGGSVRRTRQGADGGRLRL